VPDAGGDVAQIARNHKAAAPDGAQLSPEGKPLGMIRFPEPPRTARSAARTDARCS